MQHGRRHDIQRNICDIRCGAVVMDAAQPRAVQGARTVRTLNKFDSGKSMGDYHDDEHYRIYIRDGYFN